MDGSKSAERRKNLRARRATVEEKVIGRSAVTGFRRPFRRRRSRLPIRLGREVNRRRCHTTLWWLIREPWTRLPIIGVL